MLSINGKYYFSLSGKLNVAEKAFASNEALEK